MQIALAFELVTASGVSASRLRACLLWWLTLAQRPVLLAELVPGHS